MRRSTIVGIALVALSAFVLAGSADAIPVLDQSQESSGGLIILGWPKAQTFTPEVTGILDHIDLRFPFGTDGITVWITETQDGKPAIDPFSFTSADTIGSASVTNPDADGWAMADFSGQNVAFQAGMLYAMVMTAESGYMSVMWESGAYGPGELYQPDLTGSDPWVQAGVSNTNPGADAVFRTYMETGTPSNAVIPEPLTLTLLAAGLAGMVVRRKGKRRGEGKFAEKEDMGLPCATKICG